MALDKELLIFIDEIFIKYNKELMLTALKRLGNEDDAQDVVSEVFCIATMKAGELFNHPNKIAWLNLVLDFSIRKQKTANAYRKVVVDENGRKTAKYTYMQSVPIDDLLNNLSIDSDFFEADLFENYKSILSEKEIKYLIYKFEYGLNTTQIAQKLGKTNSSTDTFAFRIREKIKKFLK